MYSQAPVRSYTKDRAGLQGDHTPKGRGYKVKNRNSSRGNLCRPHWTQVVAYHCLSVLCGGKGTAPGCAPRGSPKVPSGDSCRLLKSVDLSNTNVEEIPEFTFVHCTSLRDVLLPTTLHTIRVKAFMNCAALVELAIPPSLRYIGSRAFLDCTALKRLAKMPGKHKWRGVYAEENAFAICPAMRWPPWLHMIPDMGHTPGLG